MKQREIQEENARVAAAIDRGNTAIEVLMPAEADRAMHEGSQ